MKSFLRNFVLLALILLSVSAFAQNSSSELDSLFISYLHQDVKLSMKKRSILKEKNQELEKQINFPKAQKNWEIIHGIFKSEQAKRWANSNPVTNPIEHITIKSEQTNHDGYAIIIKGFDKAPTKEYVDKIIDPKEKRYTLLNIMSLSDVDIDTFKNDLAMAVKKDILAKQKALQDLE